MKVTDVKIMGKSVDVKTLDEALQVLAAKLWARHQNNPKNKKRRVAK